jgi:hypothetical protein
MSIAATRLARLAGLLAVLGAARAAADEPDGAALVQEKASAVTWRATATMVGEFGSLGEEDIRLEPTVLVNPGSERVEALGGNLVFVHDGGWIVPWDPPGMTGALFADRPAVEPGAERALQPTGYRAAFAASHVLLSMRLSDGHAEGAVPVVRPGFEVPAAYAAPYPFGVGVVAPLEVLALSDGGRAILVVGQHQSLAGAPPERVETRLLVASDAGGLAESKWRGLDSEGAGVALWPFVRRVDVPADFHAGTVRIVTTATLEGKEHRFERDWPVLDAEAVELSGPVLSTWQLGNGPGQRDFHGNYASPTRRYAYDLVITEHGRTYNGDGQSNASYFAWGRSVRAAADGVVVDVCDRELDNEGNQRSQGPCLANRIVLRHEGGVHTVYLHLKQGSVRGKGVVKDGRVSAGQVIGLVGNSGDSTEPHLTFYAYRVDPTGRLRALPVSFRNAYRDARGLEPLRGVPRGGDSCTFIDRPR